AEEGSRAARAAVEASRELSLMLAGAQLGITLCTLALGALAKPAVAHLLEPVISTVGVPDVAVHAVAVVLAVSVVVFLHMVVGDLARRELGDPAGRALPGLQLGLPPAAVADERAGQRAPAAGTRRPRRYPGQRADPGRPAAAARPVLRARRARGRRPPDPLRRPAPGGEDGGRGDVPDDGGRHGAPHG